jgi:hypothetical protein
MPVYKSMDAACTSTGVFLPYSIGKMMCFGAEVWA